ncbi:CCA tRNA nucleotidyltransferase [Mycoplasmatota bacterium]|nr:CCA tRNA nucleotidyltransferase [Mycoplasmatota bacterium]
MNNSKVIIKTLNEHGYDAYIVGGYVRDFLLDKENSDIDIATNALPDVVKEIFPKTILTGLKHGTVTVCLKDAQYEVTTFRTESTYINNRKPDQVAFVSNLEEDVKRRDFTMNALALTIDHQIIDYVGGKKDIEDKIIRTVGNPYDRFQEDALRMLRAFRFVSTLGFTIENEALLAIKQNAHLIKNISHERILIEFDKMMRGTNFLKAIEVLVSTSFHEHLPILKNGLETINKTKIVPLDLFEFLTICAVSSSYEQVMELPISNHNKKEIRIVYEMFELDIIDYPKPLIFRNGLRNCLFTNKLNVFLNHTTDKKTEIIEAYQSMPIHKQCDVKFKGDDIITLFNKEPGSWISDVLDDLCLKILIGEFQNEYQVIKEYLQNKYLKRS